MPTIDPHVEYDQLSALYEQQAALLDGPEAVLVAAVPSVSGWTVAQHLHHVWTANGMSLTAARYAAVGKRSTTTGEPTRAGRRVLQEEGLPRGQMQAPDAVTPPASPDLSDLRATLERSRAALHRLADHLDAAAASSERIEHPALGFLTAPQWLRFVRIHTAHHQAIIDDIRAHADA
ncbi:DinB family protein [Salisaeta longa]|uniref:DinB family protein n=1 Tax=Salisaeta longa TaxID=503170 RepID=UPI0003B5E940|nr:DinB family protein [Salisaeta longa]